MLPFQLSLQLLADNQFQQETPSISRNIEESWKHLKGSTPPLLRPPHPPGLPPPPGPLLEHKGRRDKRVYLKRVLQEEGQCDKRSPKSWPQMGKEKECIDPTTVIIILLRRPAPKICEFQHPQILNGTFHTDFWHEAHTQRGSGKNPSKFCPIKRKPRFNTICAIGIAHYFTQHTI